MRDEAKRASLGITAALSLAFAPIIGCAAAPPSEAESAMPDFSDVRTKAQLAALVVEGRLVPVLAFPEELGGEDVALNRLYITPEAAEARSHIVHTLIRMADDGSITSLDVEPSYRGESLVPTAITMTATGPPGGGFEATVEVW